MQQRLIKVAIALVAIATLLAPGLAVAGAGSLATSKVTINEQNGDFSGKVSSPDNDCVDGRVVKLMRVRSGKDEYMAQDTAGSNGEWNTGNTGYNNGRYYAKVRRIPGCDPDKSPIVQV